MKIRKRIKSRKMKIRREKMKIRKKLRTNKNENQEEN